MNDEHAGFKARQLLPMGGMLAALGLIVTSTVIGIPIGVPILIVGLILVVVGLGARLFGG